MSTTPEVVDWRRFPALAADGALQQPTPALRIDTAEDADCAAIARVHVRAWQLAYQRLLPAEYLSGLVVEERESMWRHALVTGTPRVFVARTAENVVIGFVACGPSREPGSSIDEGEIWALYVDPQAWCLGAGRLLCRAAIEALRASGRRRVGLWVIDGNDRAQRFYEGVGFRAQPGSRQPFTLGGAQAHEIRYRLDDTGVPPPSPPEGWVQC